jgi:hypothetical protein
LSLIATVFALKVTTMGHDEASQDGIRLAGYFMTPGLVRGAGLVPLVQALRLTGRHP